MERQNKAKIIVKCCEESDRYALIVRDVSQLRQMPDTPARAAGVLQRFANSIGVGQEAVSYDHEKDILYITGIVARHIPVICEKQMERGRYPGSIDVSRLPDGSDKAMIAGIYPIQRVAVYTER